MTRNGMAMEHFESDLGVAAFLMVRGYRLLGLDAPEGSSRLVFRFADPKRLAAEAVLHYLDGENALARAIVEAEKTLKSLLYREKNRNGHGDRDGSGKPRTLLP